MGTRLILIRHGHSLGQQHGIVDGHDTCRGLSGQGRRQVEALTERLLRTKELDDATAVYASVMRRAVVTARQVAAALPDALPVVTDCGLCEIHEPALDGEPRLPRVEHWRRVGFDSPTSPGAETYREFMQRATDRLNRIVDEHRGETAVVVTHAGVIRFALSSFGGTAPGLGFLLQMRNTSITELVHDADEHRPFDWALERYNDAAHLAHVDATSDGQASVDAH